MIDTSGHKKQGAPIGNRNSLRHGLRAGSLPKGASYIKREINLLRREIETAVMNRHGEIDLYRAALIQTAIRWERHGMLVQRWLRREAGEMDAAQRLAYSRDIARASESRDRCLKELGLNAGDHADILDALYSTPDTPVGEAEHDKPITTPDPDRPLDGAVGKNMEDSDDD
jgi:hypothetical protein